MKKIVLLTSILSISASLCLAQKYEFKELKHTHIKGAPKLMAPQILTDENGSPIFPAKGGYVAVALYDWDRDGKKDLLVGDYAQKEQSNIMVYKNVGTDKKPIYSENPFQAKNNSGEVMYINGA